MYHKSVAVRLAYGSMSLFIAILHNVFLLYYVDIFVSVYKIDRNSFWLGEVGAFVFVSSDMFCYVIKAMYRFWNIRSGTLNKIWIYAGIDAVRSLVHGLPHIIESHDFIPCLHTWFIAWNPFLRVSINEM